MKKKISFILALFSLVSLVACSKKITNNAEKLIRENVDDIYIVEIGDTLEGDLYGVEIFHNDIDKNSDKKYKLIVFSDECLSLIDNDMRKELWSLFMYNGFWGAMSSNDNSKIKEFKLLFYTGSHVSGNNLDGVFVRKNSRNNVLTSTGSHSFNSDLNNKLKSFSASVLDVMISGILLD